MEGMVVRKWKFGDDATLTAIVATRDYVFLNW